MKNEYAVIQHKISNALDDLSIEIKKIVPEFEDPATPQGKTILEYFEEAHNRIWCMVFTLNKRRESKTMSK